MLPKWAVFPLAINKLKKQNKKKHENFQNDIKHYVKIHNNFFDLLGPKQDNQRWIIEYIVQTKRLLEHQSTTHFYALIGWNRQSRKKRIGCIYIFYIDICSNFEMSFFKNDNFGTFLSPNCFNATRSPKWIYLNFIYSIICTFAPIYKFLLFNFI